MSIHAPKIIYARATGSELDLNTGRHQLVGDWREQDNDTPPAMIFVRQESAPSTAVRRCTMEAFAAALLAAGLDAPVIKGAISAWIKGDWQAALLPLSDDARARLTGKGGAA
ncbi:MAG: hypothetical protein CMH13_01500 [Martelella sp.]|uniref:hypothetical protein n=1 Tax=unclassified Martelella TaxID=2629616 RepID=UPI000C5E4714|nr:hypothetical protein [Martelella sp.]MAU19191.1 hypothetical protein [Martelella sp.]|tara:strand:- start:871 stop:1206 length:336 start_codon:yes stop_codon:yes gene_type:complete